MNKIELRKFALEKRKSLKYNKDNLKEFILSKLNMPKNTLIAIYKPLKYEFDLTFLDGIYNVCYPKTYEYSMVFYKNVTKFAKSSFGVLEPVDGVEVTKDEIDLMIVPSLVINSEHYRIGYGKGYYDKFLTGSNIKTISIIYKDLYLDFLPSVQDVKIDEVILWETQL